MERERERENEGKKAMMPDNSLMPPSKKQHGLIKSIIMCMGIHLSSPLLLNQKITPAFVFVTQARSPPSWHYPPVVASSATPWYTPHSFRRTVPEPPRTGCGPNPYRISTRGPDAARAGLRACRVRSCDRRAFAPPWPARRWS